MQPRVVQLFVTCLVDSLFPSTGEAVVTVLERYGITVEFPFDQTCCGQPAFNAGFPEEAAVMARHTVAVLQDTEGPIVVPSGSCARMIIDHSLELLGDDPEWAPIARAVADRTREFTTFLVDDLGITDLGATANGVRATYHPSCHGLRGLRIVDQPRRLLEKVDGLDFVELPEADTCCGFGGIFSVEMSEISAAMLDSKVDNVLSTGADLLVGFDVGCLMHIEGGLRRRRGARTRTKHIAEALLSEET